MIAAMSEQNPKQAAAELDRLLAEFGPRLHAIIASRCPRNAGLDPDEVEQEVRIRLWRSLQSQTSIAHPASYLYRIAMSVIVDQLRSRRARPDLDGESLEEQSLSAHPVAPSAGDEGLENAVRVAIAALHERRRRPVQLHLQGFGFAEVARLLGLSDATARNLIYRGMDDLRELLRQAGWS